MQLRLVHKLFLIISVTALAAALAMAGVLSLSLGRGFEHYLDARDEEQLDSFVAEVVASIKARTTSRSSDSDSVQLPELFTEMVRAREIALGPTPMGPPPTGRALTGPPGIGPPANASDAGDPAGGADLPPPPGTTSLPAFATPPGAVPALETVDRDRASARNLPPPSSWSLDVVRQPWTASGRSATPALIRCSY